MTNYCNDSEEGVETLPVCCLITNDDNNIWCKKIVIINSHVGFRHGIKFCTTPFKECPYMSTAKLHFQEKDRIRNIIRNNECNIT